MLFLSDENWSHCRLERCDNIELFVVDCHRTSLVLLLHQPKCKRLPTSLPINSGSSELWSYLRMKPPLMAICSRSSTTRAGWLATTPSWLLPQALLAPLFILDAGSNVKGEDKQLLNGQTELMHLNHAGFPLLIMNNEEPWG